MEKSNGLLVPIIQEKIREFVADGDITTAANLLWELTQTCDQGRVDEVVILKGDISVFEKRQRIGVVAIDDEDMRRSRLAHRILMISKSILQAGKRAIR